MALNKPVTRPSNPRFSSGPCAKRPGWTLEALAAAVLAAIPEEDGVTASAAADRSPAAQAARRGEVHTAIAHLEALFAADDMRALATLRDLQPQLAEFIPAEDLARLLQLADDYDFQAARDLLRNAVPEAA